MDRWEVEQDVGEEATAMCIAVEPAGDGGDVEVDVWYVEALAELGDELCGVLGDGGGEFDAVQNGASGGAVCF